eukprot:10259828-Prorocentrum_lima.AAC.1
MDADSSALLAAVHGRLLRLICSHSSTHFQGLAVAGRRVKDKLGPKLVKKMLMIDAAFASPRRAATHW